MIVPQAVTAVVVSPSPAAGAAGTASVASTVPLATRPSAVQGGPPCAVWWAEGAYKGMRDDPGPGLEQGIVRIDAARNEYEPFLIVLRPATRLYGVRVAAGPLTNAKDGTIHATNLSI